MSSKKITLISLIGTDPFLFKKDIFSFDNVKYINLSGLFWKKIFSKKNLLNELKIIGKEVNTYDLKYLLKELPKINRNLYNTKFTDIGVDNLMYTFVLINKLLELLKTDFLELKLFNQFNFNEKLFSNNHNNLIYRFINNYFKNYKIKNGEKIIFSITTLDQLYQVKILYNFIDFEKNNISIFFYIGGFMEFTSKDYFEDFLNKYFYNLKHTKIFYNIDDINNYFKNIFFNESKESQIFGKKGLRIMLFSNSCKWGKCVFCNYWHNGKLEKNYGEKLIIVKNAIEKIKTSKPDLLRISDPSIEFEDLLLFCKEIIKNKIDIKIFLSMKYSKDFTLGNCEILYKAGVRFISIGLETVVPRINNLMKKYSDINITSKDFDYMLYNCEKVGIKLHHYSILGFPGETYLETLQTVNYLNKNIKDKKLNFYSYSVGAYSITKGSFIHKNPEKFGIEITKNSYKILDNSFIDNNKNIFPKNKLYKIVDLLDYEQFFPGTNNKGISKNFWYFIEKSHIFHVQKIYYDKNPYLEYWNKSENCNYNNFFYKKYKLSKGIQIIKIENNSFLLKNWLSGYNLEIFDKKIIKLLKKFDEEKPMIENYNLIIGYKISGVHLDCIYCLIKQFFFILK